mmetsp:Transcript_9867/g.28991  ORF Transcript_9867/g.28991 Transcript_9867/m.28991 type:complete len:238 (-) Transcript_9867:1679-2392(-)
MQRAHGASGGRRRRKPWLDHGGRKGRAGGYHRVRAVPALLGALAGGVGLSALVRGPAVCRARPGRRGLRFLSRPCRGALCRCGVSAGRAPPVPGRRRRCRLLAQRNGQEDGRRCPGERQRGPRRLPLRTRQHQAGAVAAPDPGDGCRPWRWPRLWPGGAEVCGGCAAFHRQLRRCVSGAVRHGGGDRGHLPWARPLDVIRLPRWRRRRRRRALHGACIVVGVAGAPPPPRAHGPLAK